MPRWLPDSFDADAHNARVRSQRSQMREQEAAHRVPQAKADSAAGTGPAGSRADAASSLPSSLGADASARKGSGPLPPPQRISDSAAGAPIYPLVGMCRAAGLPEPVPEYQWHPHRRYRADYAFPLQRVLIEYDGGLFINGGHSRGKARLYDMAKDRAATLLGWRTLRYGVNEMAQTVADLRVLFV